MVSGRAAPRSDLTGDAFGGPCLLLLAFARERLTRTICLVFSHLFSQALVRSAVSQPVLVTAAGKWLTVLHLGLPGLSMLSAWPRAHFHFCVN